MAPAKANGGAQESFFRIPNTLDILEVTKGYLLIILTIWNFLATYWNWQEFE